MNNLTQPVAPPVVPGALPVAAPVALAIAGTAAPPVAGLPTPPVAAPIAGTPVPPAVPPAILAPPAVAAPVVGTPVPPIAGTAPAGYTPGAPTAAPPAVIPAPVVSDPKLDGDTLAQAQTITEEQIQQEYEASQQNAKGPEYAKMVLKQGDNYLRLLGVHKKIKIHWIPGDDGNTRPYRCTDKCPICNIISPFLTFTLVDAVPGAVKKMRRKYAFEDIHTALSKKITGDSILGQQGWNGKERTLFNCIDRMDNWCVENNHTKVLAYSDKAIGIGGGCSEDIWQLAREYGVVDHYDIKISRSGLQRNTKYTVMLRAQGMFALTTAEQTYKVYNLEKIIEAYPDPNNLLTEAPRAIKEIIGFLTLQGITQQSSALTQIAEQLGLNVTAQPPVQIPGQSTIVPVTPAPSVAIASPAVPETPPPAVPEIPPPAAIPAPVPATGVTPEAQAPITLAPEVPVETLVVPASGTPGGPAPAPNGVVSVIPIPGTPGSAPLAAVPAAGTKACIRCGEQNNPVDAQQCSFCGALFQ